MCLIHRAHPGCWQDGSVSCPSPSSPSYCLRQSSRAQLRHPGSPHLSAVQSATISPWQEHGMGQWQGRNKTYSCCKDIPRASASRNASQSGSLPSDSCPHTSTAGMWLCRKGSLINAKRYFSLDLRNGIHLSSLIPRFFSSFPVLSPRASAVWAQHAWPAVIPRGAEGFLDRVMYFRYSEYPDPI